LGRRHRHAWSLALLIAPVATTAGELVAGIGVDDISRSASLAGLVEVRSDPLWEPRILGRPLALRFAAAAETDADGDIWAGLGVALALDLDPRWRLEAGFLPGAHWSGSSGTDLGTDAPIFRTSIGASVAMTPLWRAGVMLSHKSNADTANDNPGTETLLFTLARPF